MDKFVRLAPELDEVNEGFSLESFDGLRAVEDDHFWFVTRNELIKWLVERFARDSARALEIGCGTGFVLLALRDALPAARIAGSELHSRGLVHARQRHDNAVELLQMDARHSGLADALDLIGAFDVLEHIPDDTEVLRGVRQALRPGGILLAAAPQHPSLWSLSDDVAHHQRRYKLGELARKARDAGLEPLYQTSFAVLTLPLMVASRLRTRLTKSLQTAHTRLSEETAVAPAVNTALKILLRAEHKLRRLGLPLPFGGSQILVARRPPS